MKTKDTDIKKTDKQEKSAKRPPQVRIEDSGSEDIVIRGARVNNLKNVDVTVPLMRASSSGKCLSLSVIS